MIGRVQLMREAVEKAHALGGADGGPLVGSVLRDNDGTVAQGMVNALEIISAPYKALDPRFLADFDLSLDGNVSTDGDRPIALAVTNAQGGQYVPLIWTGRVVTFDRREFKLPSVVVLLAAHNSWEHLVEAIEKVVTDFFDRHQRRGGIQ